MNETEILEIFKKTNALLEGHFLLTSGRHSNKYFQCAMVLQHTKHNINICSEIVEHFKDEKIDTVVSPAIGGIVVGQEVARQLGARFIFTERENGAMTLRRGFSICQGENVLICEDVVTTGGSVFEVIDVVKNSGADVIGVGIIVNRSAGKADFGVKQFSVMNMEVTAYPPEDCPLCITDIPLVKPGSRNFK